MLLEDDDHACVVLQRRSPSSDWEFVTRTLRKSVAFRSAHFSQVQEREALGNKKCCAIVVLATDYELGKIKALKPPKGFDELMEVEAEEVAKAPPLRDPPAPPPAPMVKPPPAVATAELPAEAEEEVEEDDDEADLPGEDDIDI